MSSCKELFWHRFCSYHQRITEEVFSVKEIVTIMLSVLIFVIALSCEQSQKKSRRYRKQECLCCQGKRQMGLCRRDGEIRAHPQFDGAVPFEEGFAQVCVKRHVGPSRQGRKVCLGPRELAGGSSFFPPLRRIRSDLNVRCSREWYREGIRCAGIAGVSCSSRDADLTALHH